MNLKRWIAWTCVALMLVADIFLFQANHQKESVLANLGDSQVQLHQTQAELDTLKNSHPVSQMPEILRLRRQNEILSNQVAALQAAYQQLDVENVSNAQHLATARLALRLQQEHLWELEDAYNQAADTNAADAVIIARKTCINNLRLIDDAKQEWSVETGADNDAVPTVKDLLPYLKNGVFPVCPSGGTYSINAVNEVPTCSYPGHAMPE